MSTAPGDKTPKTAMRRHSANRLIEQAMHRSFRYLQDQKHIGNLTKGDCLVAIRGWQEAGGAKTASLEISNREGEKGASIEQYAYNGIANDAKA